MTRNIQLYPWFQLCRNLLFWQAVWFLYFDDLLSAPEVLLLVAVADIGAVVLEVPSGYLSDRLGRKVTLTIAMLASGLACILLFSGSGFAAFIIAQLLTGAAFAFASGTDNALLYESLAAEGRGEELADQELKAWRFSFAGLGLSAAIGGFLAMWSMPFTYVLSGIAAFAGLLIVMQFSEPPHSRRKDIAGNVVGRAGKIWRKVSEPTLAWLFVFAVSFYAINHVPYVFAQPILKEVLGSIGFGEQVPWVSGMVIAIMMLVSVAAGWMAKPLKERNGLAGILILAISAMTALVALLAITQHPIAIGLIMLRMVPEAFSRPFILATIQPRIEDDYRATYLSIQNLAGKLLLSLTLLAAAGSSAGASGVETAELARLLPWYAAGAAAIVLVLAATARKCLPKDD